MSESNRGGHSEALSLLALAGLLIAAFLTWGLGYIQGGEAERRQETPAAYSQAAKTDAQRSCAGREIAAVFECIYEKVEAAQEQARGEQDLSAQQRAASAALASAAVALLTLIVTGIGVWFVKRTLDATLKAVEDTSEATRAMQEANRIASRVSVAELRPYLFVENVEVTQVRTGDPEDPPEGGEEEGVPIKGWLSAVAVVHLRNFGKVPARNIRFTGKCYLAELYKGRFWKFSYLDIGLEVCAPSHERRVFVRIYISDKEREEFDASLISAILRIRYTYADDTGNTFEERAAYRMDGGQRAFYLLMPVDVRGSRERWKQYELKLAERERRGRRKRKRKKDQAAVPE